MGTGGVSLSLSFVYENSQSNGLSFTVQSGEGYTVDRGWKFIGHVKLKVHGCIIIILLYVYTGVVD